ncbi:hypothetical protein IV203_005857 [Nitzschia inconspicua]|uniref:Uncharacterized protein n=1 Tax=Nitzschia inconspicua TaxID=303405 RepID=A0A9K3KPL6_9STRA|nr:hypothetical protein IV203_005857 [Nitzschia inconspicua]
MDNPRLILPICLACVAVVLPIVGYFWIRWQLKDEEPDGHDRTGTIKEYSGKYPPDLTEFGSGGTESMDPEEGVENYLPSNGKRDDDNEAQKPKQQEKQDSSSRSRQRRLVDESVCRSMASRNNLLHTSSVDSSCGNYSHKQFDERLNEISASKITSCSASAAPDKVKLEKKRKQRMAEVDVHSCISKTCEMCRCEEQQQQIHFVSAQRLDSNMVQKLKHVPESARWWEMGESFHDLYHQAQQRAAEKFRKYYRSSPRRSYQ